tara:strand:- start:2875 stop:3828 length:954 start_codon:yes stop_codon:yes gene_type:complete
MKNYMKTKFAIGCLVQWYECDIIEEYVDSLKDAISAYDGEVMADFTVITNEDLERCVSPTKKMECLEKIAHILLDFENVRFVKELHTIADYRKGFNDDYCSRADVLIWGESDAILPKQMFTVLDNLHQMSLQNNNPKYLAFFGTCKMWDDSWLPIEHNDFTDKPCIPEDYDNWWSLKYTMSKAEMNKINEKVDDLDVRIVSPHKFNGCGLVISSEVIKAGVNIPKSVFFVHEDSAFMYMTNKLLGNIPQYIIKNILLVHNRNHPEKRNYVQGEIGDTLNGLRRSNKWYVNANKMCEQNYLNMFNPNYKSYTWEDVWD